MTLLWVILATALTLGLLFALITYSLFWLQRRAARQFEQKFQDANQLIQGGRPPAAWVQSERAQVKKMRSQGKNGAAQARIGARARQRCLRNLRALIHFLGDGRFYDSLETRELIVERLWGIHGQWLQEPWEYFIDG
ncbi:MAG: hypothetical protein DCC55_04025 [Chloroflexi bacterium]|nr:MAG: hypothetical protein DCC55_04025 [Chloroflexota bacterium]